MKRRLRKDRLFILISGFILIIVIIIFIIHKLSIKSYSLEYDIDDISISENFDKKNKYYYYKVTYNNLFYDFIYESDYIKERKLIKDITKYSTDNEVCLIIESKYFETNPLCSIDDSTVDYHLVSKEMYEKIKKFTKEAPTTELKLDSYEIYNTEDTKVLWNYKGINIIKDDIIKSVNIFNKDFYDVTISTLINNYFIVADYEQSYNFTNMYIVDIDTLEVTKWDLDTEISFESYILGTNDKSVYLLDKKNRKEYELVPHKQKMRKVSGSKGIIYENGEEKPISMDQLVGNKYTITNKNNYKYQIINDNLYLSYIDSDILTKVSNQKIDSIISINNDNIYYLIGTYLYRYNLTYGEVKLMKYSEWEFNNTNVIFIK